MAGFSSHLRPETRQRSAGIYRAANMLIERHGTDAPIDATRTIDRMLDHGDTEGRQIWQRIKRAIEALQAPRGSLH